MSEWEEIGQGRRTGNVRKGLQATVSLGHLEQAKDNITRELSGRGVTNSNFML